MSRLVVGCELLGLGLRLGLGLVWPYPGIAPGGGYSYMGAFTRTNV